MGRARGLFQLGVPAVASGSLCGQPAVGAIPIEGQGHSSGGTSLSLPGTRHLLASLAHFRFFLRHSLGMSPAPLVLHYSKGIGKWGLVVEPYIADTRADAIA